MFTKGKDGAVATCQESLHEAIPNTGPRVIGHSQAPIALRREGTKAGLLRLLLYRSMKTILQGC
jgi:hypothetical protein